MLICRDIGDKKKTERKKVMLSHPAELNSYVFLWSTLKSVNISEASDNEIEGRPQTFQVVGVRIFFFFGGRGGGGGRGLKFLN